MKILFYDTECNSLDTNNGFIMELAYAVYDLKSQRRLYAKSNLLRWYLPYTVEPDAFAVTGLTKDFCDANGFDADMVLDAFVNAANEVDYVCGHNVINYDLPMIKSNIDRFPKSAYRKNEINTPHIDTLTDIPYPTSQKQLSLKYLAFDHGYVIKDAHSALSDVFASAHLFFQYPTEKIFEISKTPMFTVSKKIDYWQTQERDRLKKLRFYWNPQTKCWQRKMRQYFLEEIRDTLGDVSVSKDKAEPTEANYRLTTFSSLMCSGELSKNPDDVR